MNFLYPRMLIGPRLQRPAAVTLKDIVRVDDAGTATMLLSYLEQHGCPITDRIHLFKDEGAIKFTAAGSKAMVLMPCGLYQNLTASTIGREMQRYTQEERERAPTDIGRRQRYPSSERLQAPTSGLRRLAMPGSPSFSGSSTSSSFIVSPPTSPPVHTMCAPLGAPFAVLRDEDDDHASVSSSSSSSVTSSLSSSASAPAAARHHYP